MFSREKTTIILRNCSLRPLKLYKGQFQVYCINPEVRIRWCFKGAAHYHIQMQTFKLHVHDGTPNLGNFVLMSLTELNLQQII